MTVFDSEQSFRANQRPDLSGHVSSDEPKRVNSSLKRPARPKLEKASQASSVEPKRVHSELANVIDQMRVVSEQTSPCTVPKELDKSSHASPFVSKRLASHQVSPLERNSAKIDQEDQIPRNPVQPTQGSALEQKRGRTRFIVLGLGVLHLTFIQASSIAFNASYVSMANIHTSPLHKENSSGVNWSSESLLLADRRYLFTPFQKCFLFAGLYIGAIIGTQPAAWFMRRFGARKSLTLNGGFSILLSLSTPAVAATSFPLFVAWRVLAGIAFCTLFPAAGTIVANWAPQAERGLFVGILCAHLELAALFTMPFSGIVAKAVSWPAVYYLHALFVAITTTCWFLFYRDRPNKHYMIRLVELKFILQDKNGQMFNSREAIPLRRILSTRSIWAICATVFGTYYAAQFSITFAPSYISYVLGYSPAHAGAITFIPLLLQAAFKFSSGFLSDRLIDIREQTKVRVLNSLGLVGSAIFFLLIVILPKQENVIDLILIILAVSLLGLHSGGFPKAVVLIARQHAPFIMSIVQMLAGAGMATGSMVVPTLTPTLTEISEWRLVFLLYAVALIAGNTAFTLLVKTQPAEWTT